MGIIEASALSKHYRIYPGPRSLVKELVTGRPSHTLIKALDDISFELTEGEAFGVVGENGAGKSTLLKLMTGTAVPTAGSLRVEGRVSALLELGAGFHHEFSGRENIYFSGALAGFNRSEIAAREDDIIGFSELEASIDNPVKTYSTGMVLRLGFAIATGFEPTILIIDEALAVGDQRFQKRCTDRILDFKRQGVTILFCSHNLHVVKSLCDRALWLERGREKELGPAARVADRFSDYMRGARQATATAPHEIGDLASSIRSVAIRGPRGANQSEFETGDTLELEIEAEFTARAAGRPTVGYGIVRNDGEVVYTTSTALDGVELVPAADGRVACRAVLPRLQLLSGEYSISAFTMDESSLQVLHSVEDAARFVVSNPHRDRGLVRLEHRWE